VWGRYKSARINQAMLCAKEMHSEGMVARQSDGESSGSREHDYGGTDEGRTTRQPCEPTLGTECVKSRDHGEPDPHQADCQPDAEPKDHDESVARAIHGIGKQHDSDGRGVGDQSANCPEGKDLADRRPLSALHIIRQRRRVRTSVCKFVGAQAGFMGMCAFVPMVMNVGMSVAVVRFGLRFSHVKIQFLALAFRVQLEQGVELMRFLRRRFARPRAVGLPNQSVLFYDVVGSQDPHDRSRES
jgi:hypothetical protein